MIEVFRLRSVCGLPVHSGFISQKSNVAGKKKKVGWLRNEEVTLPQVDLLPQPCLGRFSILRGSRFSILDFTNKVVVAGGPSFRGVPKPLFANLQRDHGKVSRRTLHAIGEVTDAPLLLLCCKRFRSSTNDPRCSTLPTLKFSINCRFANFSVSSEFSALDSRSRIVDRYSIVWRDYQAFRDEIDTQSVRQYLTRCQLC